MATEENKAIVLRLLEQGFNTNDAAVFDELLTDDFVNHDPSQPDAVDRVTLKQFWTALCHAFPDQHTAVEDLVGEGDTVVKRAVWRGTQTGELQGIPPTGKQATMSTVSIYRIADGKVREMWWAYDSLGLLRQLGFLPEPAPATA
jgi:steroid delta-isomerase-like uncharacterized protein